MSLPAKHMTKALVLRWNDYNIRVRCPYCLYSDAHTFTRANPGDRIDTTQGGWQLRRPEWCRVRQSDCSDPGTSGEYVFVFPTGNDAIVSGYGWEVDRENSEFVTTDDQGIVLMPVNDGRDGRTLLPEHEGRHEPPPFDDEADELAYAASQLSLRQSYGPQAAKASVLMSDKSVDDFFEQQAAEASVPMPTSSIHDIFKDLDEHPPENDPVYRKFMYASHVILGQLPELMSLCDRYPDDGFIGSFDEEGNTDALLAATEEHGLETLRWLHTNGESLSRPNHYGRTPLMEASLWGRLRTCGYLTQQGVDLGARDGNGMSAADLASDSARNSKERAVRLRGPYREPPDAGRKRKQIQVLLERLSPQSTQQTGMSLASQGPAFFNRTLDGRLDIFRPQEALEYPDGRYGPQFQKAFATLDRGPSTLISMQ